MNEFVCYKTNRIFKLTIFALNLTGSFMSCRARSSPMRRFMSLVTYLQDIRIA